MAVEDRALDDLDAMFNAVAEKAGESLQQSAGLVSRERFVITVNDTYSYGPYSRNAAMTVMGQIEARHQDIEWQGLAKNVMIVSQGIVRMKYVMTELEDPDDLMIL